MTDAGHVATSSLKRALLWPPTCKASGDEGTGRAEEEQEQASAFQWASIMTPHPTTLPNDSVVRNSALGLRLLGSSQSPFPCLLPG